MRWLIIAVCAFCVAASVPQAHEWAYSPSDSATVHQWWEHNLPGGVGLDTGVRGTIDGDEVIWHAHPFDAVVWDFCTGAFESLDVVYGNNLGFVPVQEGEEESDLLALGIMAGVGLLGLGGFAYRRFIA